MKTYVLIERIFNYDSGEENTSWIDGVYSTKEKAIEERRKLIVDNVLNFGFIIDEELKKHSKKEIKKQNLITLFYDYQENWNNYIELEIIEKEIE